MDSQTTAGELCVEEGYVGDNPTWCWSTSRQKGDGNMRVKADYQLVINARRLCFLLTTFALCRGVQVKDHIQCLSQLPWCAFALPVLTHGSDVHCLRMETAVEEFFWLQQDSKTSLQAQQRETEDETEEAAATDNWTVKVGLKILRISLILFMKGVCSWMNHTNEYKCISFLCVFIFN